MVSAVVSISVGVILFDSGLDLKLSDLRGGAVARVSRRLVTLGILVTWAVGTVASYLLFDLAWEVALVLGAVLVVSGPTVVGPLLDFIRPSKTVGRVLKWEGTLADPIGATLGVVVYQAVLAGQATAGREILDFLLNVGVGVGLGLVGAALAIAWARWFRPDQGQALTGILMIVVASVVAADLLRDDSGLLTGLVIGAVLVNRAPGRIEPRGFRIESAKLVRAWRARIATLATFLIGILFIILSARVSPEDIARPRLGQHRVRRRPGFRRQTPGGGAFDARLGPEEQRAGVHRLDGPARDRCRSNIIDVRAGTQPGGRRRRVGEADPDHLRGHRRHGTDLRAQRRPGGEGARRLEHRTRRGADHRRLTRGAGDRAGAERTGGDGSDLDQQSRARRRPPATRA